MEILEDDLVRLTRPQHKHALDLIDFGPCYSIRTSGLMDEDDHPDFVRQRGQWVSTHTIDVTLLEQLLCR